MARGENARMRASADGGRHTGGLCKFGTPISAALLIVACLWIVDRVVHPQGKLDDVVSPWPAIIHGQTMADVCKRVVVPLRFTETGEQRLDVWDRTSAQALP